MQELKLVPFAKCIIQPIVVIEMLDDEPIATDLPLKINVRIA